MSCKCKRTIMINVNNNDSKIYSITENIIAKAKNSNHASANMHDYYIHD